MDRLPAWSAYPPLRTMWRCVSSTLPCRGAIECCCARGDRKCHIQVRGAVYGPAIWHHRQRCRQNRHQGHAEAHRDAIRELFETQRRIADSNSSLRSSSWLSGWAIGWVENGWTSKICSEKSNLNVCDQVVLIENLMILFKLKWMKLQVAFLCSISYFENRFCHQITGG